MSRTAGARGGGIVTAVATGLFVILLTSCATGGDTSPAESPSPPPTPASDPAKPPKDAAGKTLTVADHGSTVRLRVGDIATLQLANPVTADPEISGDAVRLDAIVNVAESPIQQWEIHAVRPGTSRITASDGKGRTLVLTVDVRD